MRSMRWLPFIVRPILAEDFSVLVLQRPYVRAIRGINRTIH